MRQRRFIRSWLRLADSSLRIILGLSAFIGVYRRFQSSNSAERARERFEQQAHVVLGMIDAEPEAQPPPAAVDDHALQGDAPVALLGVVDVEGEEVAAGHRGGRDEAR